MEIIVLLRRPIPGALLRGSDRVLRGGWLGPRRAAPAGSPSLPRRPVGGGVLPGVPPGEDG